MAVMAVQARHIEQWRCRRNRHLQLATLELMGSRCLTPAWRIGLRDLRDSLVNV